MSTLTASDGRHAGSRPAGSGLVLAADRSDGFRRARRHTRLVRLLRVGFPVLGLGLSIAYLGTLLHETGLTSGLAQLPMPRITAKDLTMHNPHYEGTTEDGGTYRVAAARARQDFKRTEIIELEEITGDLTDSKKVKTRLTAVSGTFDHKRSILVLNQKIDIASDDGLRANLTTATVKTKEGLITSTDPVSVGFPAGTVQSKQLTIRQKTSEASFLGDVVAKLKPPARPAAADGPTPAATPAATPAEKPLFSASDAPVDITSERLDIDDQKKTAVFTGNVRAMQADAQLQTPAMTVVYEGDVQSAAPGAAQKSETPASAAADAGKVKRIEAKGPFVMLRGTTDRVTGDVATFDVPAETALLEGNIVMTALPDRKVTAERVELDQKTDSAVLTGNVVVANGETILKGRRLALDRKNGRTSLTSPPMAGSGPGRIAAHFVQKKPDGKKAEPAPVKEPANPAGAVANFKTDPGAPLDIDADSLDVDDTKKVAIFRGDVEARQGEVKIRSAEIKAFYSGSARLADVSGDEAPTAAKPAAEAKDKPSTELTRIEAGNGVIVTTADNRKVTGDWATYDAKANTIVVGGDVELSQGSSVIRGTRLLIDMATGQSTIDTAPAKTVAEPAGGGWMTEAGGGGTKSSGGRPSAIFFPNELRNAQGGGKKENQPGSGWNSTTAPAKPAP